jgi:hypothetical protein
MMMPTTSRRTFMNRVNAIALGMFVAGLLTAQAAPAQTDAEKERAELAKALGGVKVSLQQGLTASERQGRPISGKFEVEEGHLQLSLYTDKSGKFSEVIVDHQSGKMAKSEDITKPEDLTAAKEQAAAMAKAKRPLRAAVDKTVKANPGFRAVSVYPSVKDGHPIAEITLLRGQEFKMVTETLD